MITFDTLEYAETLRKHGLSQEQAEGLAKANQRALEQAIALKDMATKKDLQKLKLEIVQWVIGCNLAMTALFIAALAWLKP